MPSHYGDIIINGNIVKLRVGRDWFYYDTSFPPLGEGAMGTVFLGRHLEDHHYLVAIKLVKPQYSDRISVRIRARQEAALAFRHHNLVEMVGICENGDPKGPMFIISNFVSGSTIDNHIMQFARRPDRVKRIVNCMLPILDALDFIHEKGIIHLDIKPSNIMVENGCNVRLMDLGICFTPEFHGTDVQGLLGTPGYAAPEQYITDDTRDRVFTPATDIYQFGATLYELLSGITPYSKKDGGKLKNISGVDKRLMTVLTKSLDPQSDKRYQSVRELSSALRKALIPHLPWYKRLFN